MYGDLQDDLPPPPQEMSSLGAEANFTPPHIPPPPPPVATTPVGPGSKTAIEDKYICFYLLVYF